MPGSRFPEKPDSHRKPPETEDSRTRTIEITKKFTREDFQDIARFGGDILKRTVNSGLDAIKEVKDGLPKEVSQVISVKKEEIMRGLSKEVAQNIVSGAIDKVFSMVRQHKIEISIKLKRDEEATKAEKAASEERKKHRAQKASRAGAAPEEEREDEDVTQ